MRKSTKNKKCIEKRTENGGGGAPKRDRKVHDQKDPHAQMAEEIPWDASNGGEVSKDPSRGGGARRPEKVTGMQRVRTEGRSGVPARETTVAPGGGNDPTHQIRVQRGRTEPSLRLSGAKRVEFYMGVGRGCFCL